MKEKMAVAAAVAVLVVLFLPGIVRISQGRI